MIGAAARTLPLIVALAGAVGGDVLASNGLPSGPVQPHWVGSTVTRIGVSCPSRCFVGR